MPPIRLDPACGSGGRFVSAARFVSEQKQNPAAGRSRHRGEPTAATGRVRRRDLVVTEA